MLIFGPSKLVFEWYTNPEKQIVLNFSSYMEGFYRLNSFNPLNFYNIGISATKDFDLWYANFLSFNKATHKELVDIMRQLSNGVDVYIMVDYSIEFSNILIESLSKFILEKYGYTSNMINDKEDLDYLVEGDFSRQGIMNLEVELEEYVYEYGEQSLPNYGEEI